MNITSERAEALRKAGHQHVLLPSGDCVICDREAICLSEVIVVLTRTTLCVAHVSTSTLDVTPLVDMDS